MAYLQLPNGKFLKIPEGMSPDQAYNSALEKFPDLLKEVKPKKGIGAALGRGVESFLGTGQTTLESVTGAEEAAEKGLRRQERLAEKYEDQIGLDKVKEAYEKKGITGAVGEVGRQIPLALAEQAPNIAATLAGAKVGAMGGSAFGPVGTVLGGAAGALAPSALQLFGSNIERQAAEQQAAGQPTNINVQRALGATALQAPLDVAATFIPLGGRIAGKVFGKEVEQLLARGGTKAAEKLAQESLTKSLAKGTAFGAAVEVPTEITQQMLERFQAGLPLTTQDALKEYGEVAYQAGLLGPIGAAGRISQKGAAREQIEQQKEVERAKAREEQAVKDQLAAEEKAQEELRTAQAETGQLFGEAVGEVSPLPGARSTLTVAEKEAQAAALKESQVTERGRLVEESSVFERQLADLEKQREAAAEKGDFKTFSTLNKQAEQLESSLKDIDAKLKELPLDLKPEEEMAKLRGEQKRLIRELQKYSNDPKRAAPAAAKLEEIDKRINDIAPAASQMDLFDEAMLGAEQRAAVQQQKEQRAQEQADLFAQTKTEKLEDVDAYKKGLQDLEEAYAAGASDRIIAKLVDELQRVGRARDEQVAKVEGVKSAEVLEEDVVKGQRIRRAIAEEQTNYDNATNDEEKAAALANIGALQRQLATARTEQARPQPENLQRRALDDQAEAVENLRTAIEDIKSGRFFGGKDVATVASLKTGLINDANKAVGEYVEAALRDINASRELARQQALTTDEALQAATNLRNVLDKVVKNQNLSVLLKREPVTRTGEKLPGVSGLERQLQAIKDKYRKGPSKVQKVTPLLRQQFGRPEKEEVGKLAKDEGLTVREKEAGVKPSQGGVDLAQRELFGEKELEPVATVRATPENFRKFLGSATVFKLKQRLQALTKQAEKQEQALSKKFTLPSKEFLGQLEQQRRFVTELQSKDTVVAALRNKATQLWNTKTRDGNRQADEILKQIDDIYADVKTLEDANLKTEKAILASMERKLAQLEKGSPAARKLKAEAEEARSRVAQAETAREQNLQRQAKEKRELEEKQATALKALPSVKQEIVETRAKKVGTGEPILQKKITKTTPETAVEKRERVVAEAREEAKERQAIREQVKRGMTPQQMETEVKKFRAAAEESRKKGNERQAKRQEETAKSLEKQLKSKMAQARLAMTGVKERPKAQPPKMKTGVAKEGKERARIDYEQEARDAGISREDYEFVERGLAFGFKARAEEGKGAGVSQSEVQARVNKVKMPKGLKVVVMDKLPPSLAERIAATGYKPENVRGGVLPDGTVIIVAENHTDMKDVERTIAHELIGHVGVEGLIGESGMKALAKQIQKTDNSVFDLAKKLGVLDDVLGAYAVARKSKSEEDSVLAAVRELIAHTEETRPDKNFLQKAGEFIKAMVGAVRAGLRKMGLDLDISTSDIYKLLRDARKNFNEGSPGAYVNKDGDIVFRSAPAQANAGFEDVLSSTDGVIAQQKPLIDRIKGEATGLIFKTKYIDRFAPVQAVAKKMEDSLKATQLMYFLRMHDQRMAFNSEIASNGPIDLKPAKDGKGLIVESTPGANLKDMAAELNKADVGNTEATVRVFTLYLAAKRAKRVGLNKLNFGGKVTQQMLDNAEKAVNASPKTKEAFENAAKIYAKYNEGLVNFAVKTGALSKKLGADLLKDGDYVPFYRQTADGSVFLDVGGAPAIKIGNLKDQPYLHELVGGDQPILDVFTSALQNTSMLTDMALRNLATRNVAFALGDMGLLKKGEGEKGIGLHKGDGPRGASVIHFKIDGENHWADVNTDAAGVPAELLVKGLEGVNTALPNAVKMMNVPANLLRKWVTRNPAYALRQVIRDPLNAVFVTGVNTTPIASSMKEIAKMVQGKSEGEPLLQSRGILGGQVLTGTAEDMSKILRDVTAGKKGWDYQMAKLDSLAIKGDAATRVVMYNNFIKQGLSEMEATLATLEAMNFSKRGISPSLFALSTMVPFMNAQIQGLNVIYQAFTGQMPFNEKLKVKQKLFQRAAMMVGFTMLYASLMQDDESYQNANDDEKYNNWFMPNPFGDEYIKVPIPFEIGFLFKAVPEALVNTAFGDEKARDTLSALGKMAWNSMPISMPQGIKPALETAINYSFFTGRPIESERLQRYEPGERYTERTGELAKMVGGALNISPVKIEYLIRGYTGSLPLAIGSLTNPVLRSGETGEQPESRGLLSSETPLIGSFFQAKDAGGLINKAYKDMEEVVRAKETYKKLIEEGREEQAEDYLDANADVIGMGSLAGKFRQQMGKLTQQERAIRADSSMSGAEKREALDELRQAKIDLAKMFSSARE